MKFNLQQLMLLMVLVGGFVMFYTSVLRKSKAIEVLSIAVSPDGKTIATRGTGGVDLCSRRTGRRKSFINGNFDFRFFSEHKPPIQFIDDQTIAISTKDWTNAGITYYSLDANPTDYVPLSDATRIYEREHFMDKRLLCLVSMDGTGTKCFASFYNHQTRKRLESEYTTTDTVRHVATSKDGKRAAIFQGMKTVIWDIEQTKVLHEIPHSATNVFSPGGTHLLQSRFGRNVLVDLDSPSGPSDVWEHEMHCTQATFTPNGESAVLFNAGESRVVEIELATGKIVTDVTIPFQSEASCFAFTDNGQTIVLANQSADDGLIEFDFKSRKWKRYGGFARLTTACLFALFFICWSAVWAWSDQRLRKAIGATSNVSPDVVNENDDEVALPGDRLMMEEKAKATQKQMANTWKMVSIGGFIAVVWSVIPLFYWSCKSMRFSLGLASQPRGWYLRRWGY